MLTNITQENTPNLQQMGQIEFMETIVVTKMKEAIFSSSQQLQTTTQIEIDVPEGFFVNLDFFNLSTAQKNMRDMPKYMGLMRVLRHSQTQIKAKYHEGSRRLTIQLNWEKPNKH